MTAPAGRVSTGHGGPGRDGAGQDVSGRGGPGRGGTGRDGADVVVALADGLRACGVAVSSAQVVTCGQAMAAIDPSDLGDRYWAGRVSLVTDPRHLPDYDRVFAAVLTGGGAGGVGAGSGAADGEAAPGAPATVERDAVSDRGGDADPELFAPDAGWTTVGAVASDREQLRHRRFDRASDDELAAIGRALRALQLALPHRTTRRTEPTRRGDELDLARTLDRALANDGELLDRAWRRRRTQPRRLVVLLDVSGSMSGYARAMLRFALAARGTVARRPGIGGGQPGVPRPSAGPRGVEVFAFGTRLTRLTDVLSARDPDAALAAAAVEVLDWDGGTRIGANVDELVRRWGQRGVLRGAVVVVCSDGLERGDPALLGRAMARLRRSVHRIVWVNPLAGDPRFEPSQRGMRAALPHVDAFLPGHDLAALEEVADAIARLR